MARCTRRPSAAALLALAAAAFWGTAQLRGTQQANLTALLAPAQRQAPSLTTTTTTPVDGPADHGTVTSLPTRAQETVLAGAHGGEDASVRLAEHSGAEYIQSYSNGPPLSSFWDAIRDASANRALLPVAAPLQNRPLLSLVMIVKDEASSIVGTIESVKGVVDRYTILDTGSTDGTRELIREAFRGTPGDIYEEPFIDFATTRNRAIELEGTQSVFVLMLSGDEYLRRGASLRRFCEERRDWDRWVVKAETSGAGTEEAYNVRVEYGSHDVYDSTRLHRTDARWFYVGVTHEYMTSSRGYIPAMRVAVKEEDQEDLAIPTIFHDLSTGDPQNLRARWSLDLSLLLQEWRLYPNHTRTAFYIGQSYECLQDWENAFEWYRTRWELKGWNEEAYVARYRMARVAHQMGRPWSEIQQIYLSAHAYMRQRVEPLYAMGHYYYYGATPRDHESAFIFLHRASMYPFPENLRLFIDKEVYDFKVPDLLGIVSYYTGDYEIGRNQVLRALRMRPDDMRLLKNLVYFNKRLGRDPTDVARKKIS